MAIWLRNFPLPPSQNEVDIPVAIKKANNKKGQFYYKATMIKSDKHKMFHVKCRLWALQNKKVLDQIREYLIRYQEDCVQKNKPFALKIDCYFVFHYERIITLSNQAHELDADNRLKPCLDGLKLVLNLDDRYYFAEHCEKVTTAAKELECTMIKISVMKPRTMEQIQNLISREMNTPAS